MEPLDELTGLLQRPALLGKLEESMHSCLESEARLVLVALDIDHLYQINKDRGFRAGDEVIRHSSAAFSAVFSSHGPVGRYDKDMLMAGVSGLTTDAAYHMAEELRQSIEQAQVEVPVNGLTQPLSYTVTLGIVVYPDDATDLHSLLDRASLALRRGKDSGRSTTCLYEEKDPLTGVFNRFGILRKVGDLCTAAQARAETVSLVLMDIDRFKEVNDRCGHRAGDEILRRLAYILDANFKEGHLVGRIAGDEFLVLLPGCRAETAFILAEEVRRLVEESEFKVKTGEEEVPVRVQFSGGIASFPGDATERVDLLRKADEALYRAKVAGRNRIFLPTSAQMVLKSSYYTITQLERLSRLAKTLERSEAFLLREALDNLLDQYEEQIHVS